MKLFSEKGNSIVTMPIVIAIIFFIFLILSITFINMLKPFVIYEKLSSISLKYIFVMEEYGYLTSNEREKLSKDLTGKGLIKNKITIRATDEKKEYGEPISLILTYQCDMKVPRFNEYLMPVVENKEIKIKVAKYSFCKR